MSVISKILKNNRSVFSRVLFAFLLFILIISLLGLYFFLINLVHKEAYLSLSVSDIDNIYELQAEGISADFVDDYYFDSTQWSFHGNLRFEPDTTEDLELLMPDGQWRQVNHVLLCSEDDALHNLHIPQLHLKARVDYAIRTDCIDDPEKKILSKLTYINHTLEDFSYSLTAPKMLAEIYWKSEENSEREYLEVYVDDENTFFTDADNAGLDKTICSHRLRVHAINYYDRKIDGFWQVAPVKIFALGYNDYINYSFSPLSDALSDAAGKTVLSAYYPSTFDASVTGAISFRYALQAEDYTLRKERISFVIDDAINEKAKAEVSGYGYFSFSRDDGRADIGIEELHYPMLEIDTKIDISNKKRTSSFDLSTDVTAASLHDISLFPSLKTFFTENWRTTAILSALISFSTLIIPTQQVPGKRKVGVNTSAKSVSDDNRFISHSPDNSESNADGKMDNSIFISHRSLDKEVAEMLFDFLVVAGIPREAIFCSSLPGNDVKQNVSEEVRKALKKSNVNIAILSKDYYESAYCGNEAGVFWYVDSVPAIPIALSGLTSAEMKGFLNKNYKLRYLDKPDDIAYIYETVTNNLGIPQAQPTVLNVEIQKLVKRYTDYVSVNKKSQISTVSNASAYMNPVMSNQKMSVVGGNTKYQHPIFDVKILSINKQVPGTADVIDIRGNKPLPKHKNVQLQVELCNDVIIRNLKFFGRIIDTVARKNKPYQIIVCYQESPDIKWPGQVDILTRDIYPAGVDGIPVIVQIEYNLENENFKQLFRLNEDRVYMPQSTELAKQKDFANAIKVKDKMMSDFLKPSSEIKKYSPWELWKFPVHKFFSSEVVIISKDCQDTKWNTDGGFGKYEIYDFCDEGLLLWDVIATSVDVTYYRQNELQKADTNRLLCLPFESVITYDLKGNSRYNLPIIYADFEMSEYKYYYRDKSSLMLVDNAMIVDVKEKEY